MTQFHPIGQRGSGTRKTLRVLIIAYLVLWVVEGALRKWIVPQLSVPLAVVRVPVALAVYGYALRCRLMRPAWPTIVAVGFAFIMAISALLNNHLPLAVVLYGVRADVFDIPLIFVIGSAFDYDDVLKVGKIWILLGIPTAVLCVAQFLLPNSILNTTVGGGGYQNPGAMDHYRASGSFPTGAGLLVFTSLLLVFSLHRIYYGRGRHGSFGAMGIGLSLVIYAMAVSRAAVIDGAIAVTIFLICYSYAQSDIRRSLLIATAIMAGVLGLSFIPVVREGITTFAARMDESQTASAAAFRDNILMRELRGYYDFVAVIPETPALGRGVGLGTNAGAYLLDGDYGFVLAEDEWSRITLESGPYVGIAYIAFRIAIAIRILIPATAALKRRNILPMVLFGASVFDLTTGQWGPPEIAGGVTIAAGLTLAACRVDIGPAALPLPGGAARWRLQRPTAAARPGAA